MLRLFLYSFMLLISFALIAEPWADPNAEFRVLLRQNESNADSVSSLILSEYLFPDLLTNGAKAFLPKSGSELTITKDDSNRALILPSPKIAREVYLYGGYSVPQLLANVPKDDKNKYNMLTMEEITSWNLPGNFGEYLSRYQSSFLRRSQSQHENMLRQTQRHTLSSFLIPPVIGRIIPAGTWEINSTWSNDNPGPFRLNLYQSNGLMRGSEWRFLQSFPIKTFFHDPYFYWNRILGEVDALIRQKERTAKEWSNLLAADREKIIFEELTERFASRLNDRSPSPRFPSQLTIISRELDLNARAVLRYSGQLNIEKSGKYEFEVETNSLWVLNINNELAARKMLDKDLTQKHLFRFEKELSNGLIPFTFYYARCDSPLDFTIKIKAPNGDWEVLSDASFAPAPPCEVVNIEMRDGRKFPLIRRNRIGSFMIDKQKFLQLEELILPADTTILHDDYQLKDSSIFSALSQYDTLNSLQLQHQESQFVLPKIEKINSPMIWKGVISMDLRVPSTVYDDDKAMMTIVINNGFSQNIAMYLSVKYVNKNKETLTKLEQISIPTGVTEQQIPIEIQSGTVDVELFVPGFSFGKSGVRVVNAKQLSNPLIVNYDRLLEVKTNRIYCVVIHRTALAELRTWELPRLFGKRKTSSLLVLGNSTKISEIIAKALPKSISKFEILNWPQESVNGESRLLRGLGDALTQINSDKFDGVLLIPPVSDIPLLENEVFFRYLAILADNAKSSKLIKQVFVMISPEYDAEYNTRLLQFAREYGFEVVNSTQK